MSKKLLSVLTLTFILLGAGFTYYSFTTPTIDLSPEFAAQAIQLTSGANLLFGGNALKLLNKYEGIGKITKDYLTDVFKFNMKGKKNTLYYQNLNNLIPGYSNPPNFAFDPTYNESISTQGLGFNIAPSSFIKSYQNKFLSTPIESTDPLSKIPDSMKENINKTSRLFDVWKQTLTGNTSYFNFVSTSGYSLNYPFFSLPKIYDGRNESFYNSAIIGQKDLVIVIDRSGSLNKDTFTALKNSIKSIINTLSPSDRFNILTFSDHVSVFSNSLSSATISTKILAEKYIDRIRLGGLSDIGMGFTSGLKILTDFGYQRNKRLFLTFSDGKPTSGVIQNDSLIQEIVSANGGAKATPIFYGITKNPNNEMFTSLANQMGGFYINTNTTSKLLNLVPNYNKLINNITSENKIWSTPFVSSINHNIFSNLSFAINYAGQHFGVFNIQVKLSEFLESLQKTKLYNSQTNFIINTGGYTFAHPIFESLQLKDRITNNLQQPIENFTLTSADFKGMLTDLAKNNYKTKIVQSNNLTKFVISLSPLGQTGLVSGTIIPLTEIINQNILGSLSGHRPNFEGMYLSFAIAVTVGIIIILLSSRILKEETKQ